MKATLYTVTVYFAHGIQFTFTDLSESEMFLFDTWARGETRKMFVYKDHYLNREFLCAMVVE
jgi:hypothetical protein